MASSGGICTVRSKHSAQRADLYSWVVGKGEGGIGDPRSDRQIDGGVRLQQQI